MRAALALPVAQRARERRVPDPPEPRRRRHTGPCARHQARVRAATPRRRAARALRPGSAPPSPRPEARGRSLLEGAAPILGDQRLGELFEIAFEDLVEPVLGELDPVVGDAVLGEVVGADLLGPLARADLRAARRLLLLALLLAFALVEARAENAERLRLVLELRLLVLHRDDEARRNMRDPDRGVRRVDALATRPGRAVDVDLQVVGIDLDLDFFDLRHDRDGGRGRVDPALRLRLRHALDTVRPTLPLEDGVGAVALDSEGDLLEAAAVVGARREGFRLEAAALRVAVQHPIHVAGPERRLVAARRLADLDEHVFRVGWVGLHERELQLLLERAEPLLELGDELLQVAVAARRVEVVAHLAPLQGQLVRGLELLEAPSDLRRLAVIVVDGRVRHALLRLAVGALELADELFHHAHAAKRTESRGRPRPDSGLALRRRRCARSTFEACPNSDLTSIAFLL